MNKEYLGTYNGTQFYPFVTDNVSDVNIEVFTHALSSNCRFCGHTDKFWTVAQHSLLVGKIIEEEFSDKINESGRNLDMAILLGLLHDASEAYLSDICRPVKQFMQDYLKYEEMVQDKILNAFGISKITVEEYKDVITEADNISMYAEAIALMSPCDEWIEKGKKYFSDERTQKYVDSVYTENMQIVQSVFIDEIRKYCELLDIETSVFEHLDKPVNDGIPIYKQGKIIAYISDFNSLGYYFEICNSEKLLLTYEECNNILDLYKELENV